MTIIPRIVTGMIFLSEGIQKFLFPAILGPGRFIKIGFANPELCANFTATFEITCGTLLLIGLITRLASIPLLIIMTVAFVTTKLPILLENGFWSMAHEYRTDFAMTVLLIYLLISGGGKWSANHKISKSFKHET